MKICTKCGKAMEDDQLFCHYCGNKYNYYEDSVKNYETHVKICANCGNKQEDDYDFCPFCGARVVNMPAVKSSLSMKEFYGMYASDKSKKSVRTIMILGIVFAVINLILCILIEVPSMLIDIAVILGLSFWFYRRPQKIPAYCLLGYTIISIVIGLCVNGTFSGWLLLVWAISAIKTAGSIDMEYRDFINN